MSKRPETKQFQIGDEVVVRVALDVPLTIDTTKATWQGILSEALETIQEMAEMDALEKLVNRNDSSVDSNRKEPAELPVCRACSGEGHTYSEGRACQYCNGSGKDRFC